MNKQSWYVDVMMFLIFSSIVVSVGIRFLEFKREQKCYKSQVEELYSFSDATNLKLQDLLSNYHKDVYENNDVDRISEQQLISTEYSLVLLGELYKQNIDITRILVNFSICSSYVW